MEKPRPDLGRLAASPAVQMRRQAQPAPELAPRSEPPPLPAAELQQAARDTGLERSSSHAGAPLARATAAAHSFQPARSTLDGDAARGIGWDVRPGGPRESLAATAKPAVFPPLEQTVAAALKSGTLSARSAATLIPPGAVRPAQRGPVAGGADPRPHAAVRSAAPESSVTAEAGAASKAADIQSMQTVIEQLARQLDTPAESGGTADDRAAPSMSSASDEDGAEQAITRSIEALKAASGAMRHVAAAPRPGAGVTANRGGASHAPAVNPVASRIAAAIAASQYEVYLDSIAGLADHKTRHFEITLGVKTEGGPGPDADECAALLGGGAGTRLDAAKLMRVAQIASRLSSRGASAALFTRLMPDSLVDDMVLEACADIVGRDAAIGRQLVLSFRQSAIRAFTKDHWETLATLSENGLRFAVEEMSDLAMDFDVLKTRGFQFVKADAAALLAGMQAHDGIVSPEEACRRLSGTGLSVIVGGVLDDATVTWAMGLGATFGQGALFSSPRPVKDLGTSQEAAA
jgi:cyclic-di-GMP phosphodiesterase TipF (flagellum assembly factor)